ncbi:MAG: DUF2336 domain-containing protein [Rhodospirillaceae bacterium]|nr:DUF2336 domain-containing protein [Rhodospirillaceae bacterium]
MPAETSLSYDEVRKLASSKDLKVRKDLAARSDLPPEVLYFLAEDEDPAVRQVVAANAAAPHQTHSVLVNDGDENVRTGLAEKLARLAPDLSVDERDKLRISTHETLNMLAQDELTKVRLILSETLKDVANAPPDVIKRLAMDQALEVAGPVLEFSPVLTDEDLISFIETGTAEGALSAISKRQDVGEGVSDAIIDCNDEQAIAVLLGNDTAQIREQTLDDLIDRADSVELWHAPLVSRPKLSSSAATRLAQFVADNLLDTLSGRDDLDADTLAVVKSMVHHRIDKESDANKGKGDGADYLKHDPPTELAERLMLAGKLDSKVISKALQSNDNGFVFAALSVRTTMPLKVVREIFMSHSAKGLVALAWKAGLTPKLAAQIQQRMGGISPSEILMGTQEGEFPLSDDEMNWQVKFFYDRANKYGG